MEETLILLRFNCPDGSCDYIAGGWGDLKLHVRAAHGKLMWYERPSLKCGCGQSCINSDLCIRTKKIFAHEHTTYDPNLLPHHLPSIRIHDALLKPKAADFEVHPMCEFCRECFPGDDELFSHIREKHEECFVCKRKGILHKL
jgi:hypothetical protein